MNWLKKVMNKNGVEIKEGINEIVHCFFSLVTVEVAYSYTNSKNGKRKAGKKYFVGRFSQEQLSNFKPILDDWVLRENQSRKYPFQGVVLESAKVFSRMNFTGEGVIRSLMSKDKVLYDLGSLERVTSLKDLLWMKPSDNPKDYVIIDAINIVVSNVVMKYTTARGNEKSREYVVYSLQNTTQSDIEKTLSSEKNIIEGEISSFNKKKPYRAITCVSIDVIDKHVLELR